MNPTLSAFDRLAAQSPAAHVDLNHLSPPQDRLELLHRITATPTGDQLLTPAPGHRSRRWVLTGAGITAAVAAGLLVAPVALPALHLGNGAVTSANAAPPRLLHYRAAADAPTAAELLTTLAGRAAAQPPAPGSGPYNYIQTRGFYLDESSDQQGHTTGVVDYVTEEAWFGADGSGRLEQVRGGRPNDANGYYGPGKLGAPAALPTDPAALQAELAKSHPAYGTFEWFVAVNDVWEGQVVAPAVQSALLRMLADKPDMVNRGAVTDRAGRAGIAISTDTTHSGPERITLIFDPHTGALLDFEDVRFGDSELNIKGPFVSAYTVFLSSGYTADTTSRP